MKSRATRGVAAALLAFAASCGDGNPGGPSIPAPVILCPAAQSAQSLTDNPVAVNYPAPMVSEGTTPITTACLPSSGSSFPVGTTKVNCTVRDSSQRTASCTFAVTVTKVPRLSATRFVAFGDSITSGKLAADCGLSSAMCSIQTITLGPGKGFNPLVLIAPFYGEESTAAYPRALQAMLSARYATQSFTISNEGNAGETVADGLARLPGILNADAPQILLLQEGANDMNGSNPPVDVIVEDFRRMVREAKNRGIPVFLGTILPQRPRACRAADFCDGVYHTVLANAKLRTMATAEGAVLVDLSSAFEGQESTLLGLDGLHPNEAGYQKMAEVFFETIRLRLELP